MPDAGPRPRRWRRKGRRAARRTPEPRASARSDRREEECSSWHSPILVTDSCFLGLRTNYSTGMGGGSSHFACRIAQLVCLPGGSEAGQPGQRRKRRARLRDIGTASALPHLVAGQAAGGRELPAFPLIAQEAADLDDVVLSIAGTAHLEPSRQGRQETPAEPPP